MHFCCAARFAREKGAAGTATSRLRRPRLWVAASRKQGVAGPQHALQPVQQPDPDDELIVAPTSAEAAVSLSIQSRNAGEPPDTGSTSSAGVV